MTEYYSLFVFGGILLTIVMLLITNDISNLSLLTIISFPLIMSYYMSNSLDRTEEINDIADNTITDLKPGGNAYFTPGEAIRMLDYRWETAAAGPKDFLQVNPYYDEQVTDRGQNVFPETLTVPQTVRGDKSIKQYLGRPDIIEDENRVYEKSLYSPTATDMITYYGNLGPFFNL